ncbi:alpha/beta hydrolase [Prauserella cavernicola]|uniref:Alpha/beta hydrolase n=1 Tax=Prauserella cavernicola TaxID=2800127 RepID=A0A934QUN7_9PSEU|nr:alpha/beta hydrolase [Prauserella cavernicola]MBK1786663.1 alpha/beta hydrolase [Prauserella cavernicola]
MHEAYLSRLPADLRADPLPRRESTWWRWRDVDVHVERAGDPGAPVRLLLLHGAGGHAAALWPYAAIAAARGMHVVTPDLPGYGRTRVPGGAAVRYPAWVALVSDLLRAERARHTGRLVIVGASMGGLLGYDAATRTGAADAVLATCLLDPRDPVARRHIARPAWLGAVAAPALRLLAGPFTGLRVPLRWSTNMRAISNDPELTRLVLRDRLGGGGRVPLGFLRSFLDSAPGVEPERASGPRLVLAHPAEDRWTPTEVSLRFFDRLALPKELVLLEGAGHYPVEAPGAHRLAELIVALGDA